MANIIRYNNEALFVSSGNVFSDQVSSGSINQLSRIQNLTFDVYHSHQDFQSLDGSLNNVAIDNPAVEIGFEYLSTNGNNERAIGLVTNGVSGTFLNAEQEKNYYLQVEDGTDAVGSSGIRKTVVGFGHALLNSYSISANVGNLVRSSVSVGALQTVVYSGSSGQNLPALNFEDGTSIINSSYKFNLPYASAQNYDPTSAINEITALGSRDIIMEIPTGSSFGLISSGFNGFHLQSFNLSISLNRETVHPLGYVYPKGRPIIYPIQITLQTEAIVNKYKLDSMNSMICPDSGNNIIITLKRPCSTEVAFEIVCRDIKLNNQTINSSIEGNQTVTQEWTCSVASPFETGVGVFFRAYGGTPYYIFEYSLPISGVDSNGIYYFSEEAFFLRSSLENNYAYV